eukprot:TRINITY_DN54764_c0_g1_i1.p1 TRINITY_DN54764_c0_g1~~TRINITY_DN54764_c0_g1_i1.p1  ORF type:complete len:299 (+),score=46.63 TRINITY_DN54764_c0_g1_i1:34-930(+)
MTSDARSQVSADCSVLRDFRRKKLEIVQQWIYSQVDLDPDPFDFRNDEVNFEVQDLLDRALRAEAAVAELEVKLSAVMVTLRREVALKQDAIARADALAKLCTNLERELDSLAHRNEQAAQTLTASTQTEYPLELLSPASSRRVEPPSSDKRALLSPEVFRPIAEPPATPQTPPRSISPDLSPMSDTTDNEMMAVTHVSSLSDRPAKRTSAYGAAVPRQSLNSPTNTPIPTTSTTFQLEDAILALKQQAARLVECLRGMAGTDRDRSRYLVSELWRISQEISHLEDNRRQLGVQFFSA